MQGSVLGWRPQQPQPYNANSTVSYVIEKGDILRRLRLNLRQQLTCTSGNNSVALTQPGDDAAAIRTLTIRANSADTIWKTRGLSIPWINYFLSHGENPQMNTNMGDGSTANPAFNSNMYIDFGPKIEGMPAKTWLWTGALRQLSMDVDFAGGASPWLAVNSAASGYTANPVLNVYGDYMSLDINTQRDASGNITATPIYPDTGLRVIENQMLVPGATTQFRFDMDSGIFSYFGFIINVTTTASPAVDTGGLFSSISVINGPTTYINSLPEDQLNADSYANKNRNQSKTTAGIPFNVTPRVSGSSSMAGWYFLKTSSLGRLQENIPTNGTNRLYLAFNGVTQACTINVIGLQLLDLSNAPVPGSPALSN